MTSDRDIPNPWRGHLVRQCRAIALVMIALTISNHPASNVPAKSKPPLATQISRHPRRRSKVPFKRARGELVYLIAFTKTGEEGFEPPTP